ncbi:TRAP transporter small permease [Arcobacter sp. CECT 8985]|uniref:TRAP transporter small permease n=1 Tax=Arcobacter sp. CECT 8985 TaxID=1935424 RepID=UPI00100B322E|nr:TRAP transporter small permease [Arcobacter sp. CECT 8985]RXJ86672.1 C4-dicarboxylate ABC transporter permease [Arcobacter sp. CECT 8985]
MNNSEDNFQNSIKYFLSSLDYIDLVISKFEKFMLGIGVIAMALNTIAAVISRFIFDDAIVSTDELNMIFIVVITFAGLSFAARQGRHIRMSAIYDLLGKNLKKVVMVIISFVTGSFMLFLAYFSVLYINDVYSSGRILPALGIPVYVIYLWVPIGFIITGFQYYSTIIKNITQEDVYLSTSIKDGYKNEFNEAEA